MSNIYNHRQIVPATTAATRISDLLEALKTEFDNLHQETAMYKMQPDDLENKGIIIIRRRKERVIIKKIKWFMMAYIVS